MHFTLRHDPERCADELIRVLRPVPHPKILQVLGGENLLDTKEFGPYTSDIHQVLAESELIAVVRESVILPIRVVLGLGRKDKHISFSLCFTTLCVALPRVGPILFLVPIVIGVFVWIVRVSVVPIAINHDHIMAGNIQTCVNEPAIDGHIAALELGQSKAMFGLSWERTYYR